MATHEATTAEQDPFVRIVPTQLADMLRFKSETRPLIIDVRGSEYKDGHIASAANHPEPDFHDDAQVDALVEKYKNEETIVFHCQMSQVRGPFCAKRFASRLEVLLANAEKKPRVQVLTGGYKDFSEQFKDDAELLEKAPASA